MSSGLEEEHDEGSERWLLTYSDMITLLLALFVILFAISSVNKSRFAELKTDLHANFNGTQITPKVTSTEPAKKVSTPKKRGGTSTTTTTTPQTNTVASIRNQLVQALNKAGLLQDVEFAEHNNALVLGFVAGKTFYSIDSAQLSPLGAQIVDVAGSVLRQHPNSIDIDGYTDNEPIYGGPYKDNWQLSSARALVVLEQLQHVARVNPSQLYAVSFGQYHPLVPNDSPAQQAENRRVNIVVSPVGQQVQQ